MGACHFQGLLLLFLVGASTLIMAQKLFCQKGTFTGIQEDPANTFNWTSEKVEACDNGALCQETILLVKTAGTKTAILATKSCSLDGTPAITYIRHAADPGLVAISYSNYCEDPFCNNREGLYDIWNIQETKEETKGTTGLRCPTCLAVGSCLNAPSLACPNDTDRCYQGKLQIAEEHILKHEWNCWHGDEAEGEEDEVSRPEGADQKGGLYNNTQKTIDPTTGPPDCRRLPDTSLWLF